MRTWSCRECQKTSKRSITRSKSASWHCICCRPSKVSKFRICRTSRCVFESEFIRGRWWLESSAKSCHVIAFLATPSTRRHEWKALQSVRFVIVIVVDLIRFEWMNECWFWDFLALKIHCSKQTRLALPKDNVNGDGKCFILEERGLTTVKVYCSFIEMRCFKMLLFLFQGKGSMQTYWLLKCCGYKFDNSIEKDSNTELFDGSIFPRISIHTRFNSILCECCVIAEIQFHFKCF